MYLIFSHLTIISTPWSCKSWHEFSSYIPPRRNWLSRDWQTSLTKETWVEVYVHRNHPNEDHRRKIRTCKIVVAACSWGCLFNVLAFWRGRCINSSFQSSLSCETSEFVQQNLQSSLTVYASWTDWKFALYRYQDVILLEQGVHVMNLNCTLIWKSLNFNQRTSWSLRTIPRNNSNKSGNTEYPSTAVATAIS